MLLPGQRHRDAVDGEVDVVHHRALFDLGRSLAARTAHVSGHLLDHQLDVGPTAFVMEDDHVFEAHEGSEYLAMVAKNEGASWLLAHTASLKRLRLFLGDPQRGQLPARIRRAA
jgi:hypothetical protein